MGWYWYVVPARPGAFTLGRPLHDWARSADSWSMALEMFSVVGELAEEGIRCEPRVLEDPLVFLIIRRFEGRNILLSREELPGVNDAFEQGVL